MHMGKNQIRMKAVRVSFDIFILDSMIQGTVSHLPPSQMSSPVENQRIRMVSKIYQA